MRTVWKYPWPTDAGILGQPVPATTLDAVTPGHGPVVDVAVQDDTICLWIEVDEADPKRSRRFEVFGTGHPVPDTADHVGTVHLPPLVLHVYEHRPGRTRGPAHTYRTQDRG